MNLPLYYKCILLLKNMETNKFNEWLNAKQFFNIVTVLSESLRMMFRDIDDIPTRYKMISESINELKKTILIDDFDVDHLNQSIAHASMKNKRIGNSRSIDEEVLWCSIHIQWFLGHIPRARWTSKRDIHDTHTNISNIMSESWDVTPQDNAKGNQLWEKDGEWCWPAIQN